MSLGHGYNMILLPNLGERCADIIALVRHAPPDNGEPSATAVIALRRVMVFPDPAPLS
jgi:hypothetical protein